MAKKLFRKWRRERDQTKVALRFEYLGHKAMPGTCLVCAYIPDIPWPVASVWYRFAGARHIEVLWSYVLPWARRNGVRTAVHREMERGYPKYSFFTAESNSRSKKWLTKTGFKKEAIGWRYAKRTE